jgi:hypothetical protein
VKRRFDTRLESQIHFQFKDEVQSDPFRARAIGFKMLKNMELRSAPSRAGFKGRDEIRPTADGLIRRLAGTNHASPYCVFALNVKNRQMLETALC